MTPLHSVLLATTYSIFEVCITDTHQLILADHPVTRHLINLNSRRVLTWAVGKQVVKCRLTAIGWERQAYRGLLATQTAWSDHMCMLAQERLLKLFFCFFVHMSTVYEVLAHLVDDTCVTCFIRIQDDSTLKILTRTFRFHDDSIKNEI